MSKDTLELEQEVEETTDQDDSLDETNEDAEEALVDEVEETDASQEELDYASLYEKERETREKAEKLIVKMKRANKLKEEDLDEEEDEDLDDKVNKAVSDLRNEFVGEVLDEVLNSLSSNENEKKLIRFHYDNTINKSGVSRGSIEKDLRRAKLLANETLYSNKANEMSEEEKAKGAITNSGLGTNRDVRKPVQEVKLTAQEKKILERVGIDPKTFTN